MSRQPLRPPLMWGLGASIVLSAIALWRPETAPPIVAVSREAAERAAQWSEVANRDSDKSRAHPRTPSAAPLPSEWPAHAALEPAARDLFSAVLPPPVKVVAPPPPPAPAPIAPPPPAPPAMDYRFLGRFTAPDGQTKVYLGRRDTSVEAAVGTTLDNGYVVESVTDEGVGLAYPPLGIKIMLPAPRAPD